MIENEDLKVPEHITLERIHPGAIDSYISFINKSIHTLANEVYRAGYYYGASVVAENLAKIIEEKAL